MATMNPGLAASVDEYLQVLPPDMRRLLLSLRKTIRSVAPQAEEVISYRIPTYKYHGAVVHFAAFRDHASLFAVGKGIIEKYEKELKGFVTEGTTIRFTPEKPLPASLVKKIVEFRLRENEARVAAKKGRPVKASPAKKLTAAAFMKELRSLRSDAELKKYERFFKFSESKPLKGDEFIGVRMGHVFELAKEWKDMDVAEIEKLLESRIHEIRAGGVSIMAKQASDKKTSGARLKELYNLYIKRHDRINSWDLVDLGAYHVVGRYLENQPRDVLYKLARSKDPWERRTAIVSTAHFIRKKDTEDTFRIAAILLSDQEELVNKATGWMLRAAGDVSIPELRAFLDKHAVKMPRVMLRNAIEKMSTAEKAKYMGKEKLKK
jgi:3-methyladenine DNA glycosylase AlkD/uncharacterized protein YdhG (YjbR/CyaY superfamily)